MSYDERRFAALIDDILRKSDLNTISAKRIRKSLAEVLGYDVSQYKDQINGLIEQRFDKIHNEATASAQPNGTGDALEHPSPPPPKKTNGVKPERTTPAVSETASSPAKHRIDADADDDDHDGPNSSPKPKKKRAKVSVEEDDAAFAARLQAEENSRARPTRGGATRKKGPKTPVKKKKSKATIKSAESGSDEEPRERKGGFHKPMTLSEPLAALLGETSLSRPQTVKKIWEYVKQRDLQDPSDKRQIRCDEPMRAVFKVDKVHMFTMNKILNQNLYAQDE